MAENDDSDNIPDLDSPSSDYDAGHKDACDCGHDHEHGDQHHHHHDDHNHDEHDLKNIDPPPIPELLADGRFDLNPRDAGKVIKKIIIEGDGGTPRQGSQVKVHYTGTLVDGTKFDSSRDRDDPFIFKLGSGSVIKGWDVTVATMKQGETCEVTLAADYAYGERGSPPTIPANATLIFNIELISWETEPETPEEKLKFGEERKIAGNEHVKKGEFKKGLSEYERGLSLVKYLYCYNDEQKDKHKELKTALLLNKSHCLLKLKDFKGAAKECSEVLKEDTKNAKALYRRGMAYLELNDVISAKRDLVKAAQILPNDKGIRDELRKVQETEKKQHEKEKVKYANMFEKMKKIEEEEEQQRKARIAEEEKLAQLRKEEQELKEKEEAKITKLKEEEELEKKKKEEELKNEKIEEKIEPEKLEPEKLEPEKLEPEKLEPEKLEPEKLEVKNEEIKLEASTEEEKKEEPIPEDKVKTD